MTEANSSINRLKELERLYMVTRRKALGICEHAAFKQADSMWTSEVYHPWPPNTTGHLARGLEMTELCKT